MLVLLTVRTMVPASAMSAPTRILLQLHRRADVTMLLPRHPLQGIILQTLLGVAKGMACLHASNVLHGDLKAANVLLCVKDTAATGGAGGGGAEDAAPLVELEPKVSDFGLSRIMGEGATHHSTHTMGTITHQAPGERGAVFDPTDNNVCVVQGLLQGFIKLTGSSFASR